MKKNIKTILIEVVDNEKFKEQWDVWMESLCDDNDLLEGSLGYRVVGASHEDEFARLEELGE